MARAIAAEDLTVGARYAASWDDCCAAGSFAATLFAKRFDDREGDVLDALVFDNGVTLTAPFTGVTFAPADPPPAAEPGR